MSEPDALPAHLAAGAAERALLGCVLRDADLAIDDALRVLDGPQDFFSYPHGLVFQVCLDMYVARTPVGVASVFQELLRRGQAAELGPRPAEWLAEVLMEAPTAANTRYFALQVKDASTLRHLRRVGLEIANRAVAPRTGAAAEVAEQCEGLVREVVEAGGEKSADIVALSEINRATLATIDARSADPAGGGIPSGFPVLDELIAGFRPGQLVAIGARPSIGKTALAANVLANVVRAGTAAFFASLEMTSEELSERVLSMYSDVRLSRIRKGTIDPVEAHRLVTAAAPGANGNARFFIDDTPGVTASRFAAQLRRAIRRHRVGIAAIDYLQLMTPENRSEGRTQQVSELTRALKLTARSTGVPVIMLAQLNRESEKRVGDGRPKLSDFRESGSIEMDSDIAILLHVPGDQDPAADTWQVEAIVAKNRNGPRGVVTLDYRRPYTRFDTAA